MRRAFFVLSLILTPLLVVLLILQFGAGTGSPDPVDPVQPLPETGAPPATHRIEFRLLGPDGQPAPGALCVILEPELARAEVDAAGRAAVELAAQGPVRMMAWAPGHEVLEAGPWTAPPDGGFRLARLSEPERAAQEPLTLVQWNVQVRGRDGDGLAQALVLARPAEAPEAPPWIGITGADGRVAMMAAAASLNWEVYAPGRLPRAPWLLLRVNLDMADDPAGAAIELRPPYGSLELTGLPAGEAVELLHGGEVRDLTVSSLEGIVRWPVLPLGSWTIAVAGAGTREVELAPGDQILSWDG